MQLGLTTRRDGPTTILAVVGEVDVVTAVQMRVKLVELMQEGALDLVLDLRAVDFFDSSALGVMLMSWRKLRKLDGTMRIVCRDTWLLSLLRTTGVDKHIAVHESIDAALAAR